MEEDNIEYINSNNFYYLVEKKNKIKELKSSIFYYINLLRNYFE
jgi:hypothetical protein